MDALSDQPLLFTADRRSLQSETFQLVDRPGASVSSGLGFSYADNLEITLQQIFRDKIQISSQLRDNLIGIILKHIPVENTNLTFLAAATWIVHSTTDEGLTKQNFDSHYRRIAPKLVTTVTGKSKKEREDQRLSTKMTLLRYIFFVSKHLPSN